MPEIAEKTPLYDIHVYMVGSKDPVVPAARILAKEAKDIQKAFYFWLPGGNGGSNASVEVGDYYFNKSNVAYVQIVRHRVRVINEIGKWVSPYWKDAFLEDEDDDA